MVFAKGKDFPARRGPAPQHRPAAPTSSTVQGLPSAAGNAAVVQMLRQAGHPWAQDRHQHSDSRGREAQVPEGQRSAAHDVQRATDTQAHDGVHPVQRIEAAGTVQRAPGTSAPPTTPVDNAVGSPSRNRTADFHRSLKDALTQDFIQNNVPQLANWATGSGEAGAFRMMTESGKTWQEPQYAGSPEGRAFIAEKSQANITAMTQELGPDKEWREPVRQKIEAALKKRVLHHYTPRERVEKMLGQGGSSEIKSKKKLIADNPNAKHNTKTFDENYLANDGFVFFFIEKKDAPFRKTRFSEGDSGPARITMPIDRLTESGWTMLNDFLDLEYPTLRSDAEGNLLAYRRNNEDDNDQEPTAPEFKMHRARLEIMEIWRNFPALNERLDDLAYALSSSLSGNAQSISFEDDDAKSDISDEIHDTTLSPEDIENITIGPEDIENITRLAQAHKETNKSGFDSKYRGFVNELRSEFAKSVQFNRQVRRFNPAMDETLQHAADGGEMRYTQGAAHKESRDADHAKQVKSYREHRNGNILAGSHIIPGLASRGVLEISRIEAQGGHEALVKRIIAMSGDGLVDMLLKDFIRPQAMLPWSVAITRGDVQYP